MNSENINTLRIKALAVNMLVGCEMKTRCPEARI